jgi:phosphohistidine phosphatase SixA
MMMRYTQQPLADTRPVSRWRWRQVLAIALAMLGLPAAAASEAAALAAVRDGEAVILMRHAHAAVGADAGSPVDCAADGHLSERGRNQAQAVGKRLREIGIEQALVRSSRACHALETAAALDIGPVEALPALDSIATDRLQAKPRTRTVRAYINDGHPAPLLLVTHEANITRLAGVYPREAEMVIVARPLGTPARVLARIRVESD